MESTTSKMVAIRCVCPVCGKVNHVSVYEEDYERQLKNPRAFISDLYPYLCLDDRELLISGTCSKCWDVLFKDSEDE